MNTKTNEELFHCSKCQLIFAFPSKCDHYQEQELNRLKEENEKMREMLKLANETIIGLDGMIWLNGEIPEVEDFKKQHNELIGEE